MKPGTTVIEKRTNPAFPPVVLVGSDDRMVWVDFGTIKIMLSSLTAGVVVVRGEATGQYGEQLKLDSWFASDVHNQLEFHLTEGMATAG